MGILLMAEEPEESVHPSHDPEPDDLRMYPAGQTCRRCCRFILFDFPDYRVTKGGALPCRPLKIQLRGAIGGPSPTQTLR